jgi:hypothetical protein
MSRYKQDKCGNGYENKLMVCFETVREVMRKDIVTAVNFE